MRIMAVDYGGGDEVGLVADARQLLQSVEQGGGGRAQQAGGLAGDGPMPLQIPHGHGGEYGGPVHRGRRGRSAVAAS